MRWVAGLLLLLLLGLQHRLWVGDGGLAEVRALRDRIDAQQTELEQLRARNRTLEAEVLDLSEGVEALEERARSELGMIKDGELFLQIIEEPVGQAPPKLASPATVDRGPKRLRKTGWCY